MLVIEIHPRKPQPFINGAIVEVKKVSFATRQNKSLFEFTLFIVRATRNMDVLHIYKALEEAFETAKVAPDGDVIHPHHSVKLHIVEKVSIKFRAIKMDILRNFKEKVRVALYLLYPWHYTSYITQIEYFRYWLLAIYGI
jgi:hypothetical protein